VGGGAYDERVRDLLDADRRSVEALLAEVGRTAPPRMAAIARDALGAA
jgi:hypothetical protein